MAGYQEYFNQTIPNCTEYANTKGCTQYYYGDVGYSNGCSNYSRSTYNCEVVYYLNKSYSDCGNKYFNASDDCTQYGKYSNSISYSKNVTGAGAYAININDSLVDGINKISDSISAVQHLRDKLNELASNKLKQTTVDAGTNLTSVEDVDFNDNNSSTTEKPLAVQYNELKTKMFALANAIKSSGGNSNLGTLSSQDETVGGIIHKQDIINLKNDLKAIANSCYQTYTNHQNYANGYINYSVNACYNASYTVYSRSDTCVQYTRSTCTTNYYAYANYFNCAKADIGCCAGDI